MEISRSLTITTVPALETFFFTLLGCHVQLLHYIYDVYVSSLVVISEKPDLF